DPQEIEAADKATPDNPYAFAELLQQVDEAVGRLPDEGDRRAAAKKIRKVADKHDPAPKWRPEEAEIPAALDTPEFRAAWEEWCAYRRRRKPAITENAARKQLAKMAKHPVEICI